MCVKISFSIARVGLEEEAGRYFAGGTYCIAMDVQRAHNLSNRITREKRCLFVILLIIKGIRSEEDLTRYRLIVTLVTVTNVYTPASHFPANM